MKKFFIALAFLFCASCVFGDGFYQKKVRRIEIGNVPFVEVQTNSGKIICVNLNQIRYIEPTGENSIRVYIEHGYYNSANEILFISVNYQEFINTIKDEK